MYMLRLSGKMCLQNEVLPRHCTTACKYMEDYYSSGISMLRTWIFNLMKHIFKTVETTVF